MSDLATHSVKQWIAGLKSGNQETVAVVWKRYFTQLARIAGQKLALERSNIADGEDVALSAIHCLCQKAGDGRFDAIISESGLWRLLVKITHEKGLDHLRKEQAAKRGGGDVIQEADVTGADTTLSLDTFASADPTPETLTLLEEQLQRLLQCLPAQIPRELILMKMRGCDTSEIAQHLGISLHAVRRKIRLAEERWEAVEAADSS